MKHLLTTIFVLFAILLAACGPQDTVDPVLTWTPMPTGPHHTSTPDPCAQENMQAIIKQVNDEMREFDDASQLASNVVPNQLPPIISDMQRIRRESEDLDVPVCLGKLKEYQLAHMNSVINTLLGFVNGTDPTILNESIAQARKEHDLYTLELARLLGFSSVTATPGQ
jgi:hypothetical protein